MTPDEKQIITDFVQRVVRGDQPAPAPSPWNRAPAAPPPPREPLDPEADALLKQLQDQYPEARYRLAQLAFVQEHALAEAQNRIAQLEWEAQSRGQQGGLLGGRDAAGVGSGGGSGVDAGASRPGISYVSNITIPGAKKPVSVAFADGASQGHVTALLRQLANSRGAAL